MAAGSSNHIDKEYGAACPAGYPMTLPPAVGVTLREDMGGLIRVHAEWACLSVVCYISERLRRLFYSVLREVSFPIVSHDVLQSEGHRRVLPSVVGVVEIL